MSNVAIISLWRNDSQRFLHERAESMLNKSSRQANLRWMWVVGDSTDSTEEELKDIAAASGKDVMVLRRDTGLSDEPSLRIRRQSLTFNWGLDHVRRTDTHVVHHESDLQSPPDLVDRFLDSGLCPVAGWPILSIEEPPIFYDTFAYRGLDGQKFINHPPYHTAYHPTAPFEVSSVGSCWMYYAEDIRGGVRCYDWGVVELAQKFRALGRRIWVLPEVQITQPVKTWTPFGHLQ